ncbi:hypothetical protein [Paracidovorax sp. MALMAid1276]|uniref:hypothetical protein n=1 Tax=Paracidovorax sp. MALMAid1276 TaxID=3411631 RepID=UPI003B9B4BBC
MPPSRLPEPSAHRRPPAVARWAATGLLACALAACNTRLPPAPPAPEPPRPAPAEVAPPPETDRSDAAGTPGTAPGADAAQAADDTPASDAPGKPLTAVLAHMDRILRMPAPELAREIARLAEAEEAAAENPLLLAAALAQTRQPVDTARALGLVQRVAGSKAPQAHALQPLARVLEARLLQQRRLEEQLDRQTQQLRDAQRRNEQLSERLEAVRAIERSLTTRPAPPPAPSAPSAPSAPASGTGGNTARPAPP